MCYEPVRENEERERENVETREPAEPIRTDIPMQPDMNPVAA